MRDQRRQIQFAVRDELQKGFQVARFRPAHMADRIIAPFLLIGSVVAAGTVGARDAKIQFLFVIEFALQLHADGSDGDHNGAIARHFRGQVHGLAAWSLRRDQHRVHAHAARLLEAQIAELTRAGARCFGSAPDREIGALPQQIHAETRGNRQPSATEL